MDYDNEPNAIWLPLGFLDDVPKGFILGPPRDSQCFQESAAPWRADVETLPDMDIHMHEKSGSLGW